MNFENSKYFLPGLYVQILNCGHGSEYQKERKGGWKKWGKR